MEIVNIPMNRIAISSLNTRSDLNAGTEDASLENLADSIRERGLLNPVPASSAESTNGIRLK